MLSVWLCADCSSRAFACSGRSPLAVRSRLTRHSVAARTRSMSSRRGVRSASGQELLFAAFGARVRPAGWRVAFVAGLGGGALALGVVEA